jgi:hypothetical protein
MRKLRTLLLYGWRLEWPTADISLAVPRWALGTMGRRPVGALPLLQTAVAPASGVGRAPSALAVPLANVELEVRTTPRWEVMN